MEWVEGARLSDRAMLDTYGLEPSRLVDTMVRKRTAKGKGVPGCYVIVVFHIASARGKCSNYCCDVQTRDQL